MESSRNCSIKEAAIKQTSELRGANKSQEVNWVAASGSRKTRRILCMVAPKKLCVALLEEARQGRFAGHLRRSTTDYDGMSGGKV